MPKILSVEVEVLTKSFSEGGRSIRWILNHLKGKGHQVSYGGIWRIINGEGEKRQAKAKGLDSPKKKQPYRKRTPAVIRAIRRMTSRENPPSQRQMARTTGVTQHTVRNVIKQNLSKEKRKKSTVHALKPHHIENRKCNARKLYQNRLAGSRYEYVVTIDEALFRVDYCKGQRKICYVQQGEDVPQRWVCEQSERFGDQLMIIGAISGRGVLPLMKVPPNVKINADRYVEDVLKPLVQREIPKLYPGEEEKVFIHHDAASSHTAKKTQRYMEGVKENLGPTLIPNAEIPVKSPDISPLDFFGFSFLKQRVWTRRATTLGGLWKVAQEEWNKIPTTLVGKVFQSWKRRCRAVVKEKGYQIERTNHCKKINI